MLDFASSEVKGLQQNEKSCDDRSSEGEVADLEDTLGELCSIP